jgi:hypothetical protein
MRAAVQADTTAAINTRMSNLGSEDDRNRPIMLLLSVFMDVVDQQQPIVRRNLIVPASYLAC